MKKIAVILLTLGVSACSSVSNTEAMNPVGIGSGVHELKQSPCACLELNMDVPDRYAQPTA